MKLKFKKIDFISLYINTLYVKYYYNIKFVI